MSVSLSRRSFTLCGIAVAVGGPALLSLPLTHAAVAQDATAVAGGDLSSLGLPTIDVSIKPDGYEGGPAPELAAGRYLVTATIADGMEYGEASFVSPPAGMSAEDFLDQMAGGGGPPEAAASPGAPPAGEEAASGGEMEMQMPLFLYRATFAGGAGGPGGTTAQAVIDLTPGEWIFFGEDPSAAKSPLMFTVTGDMPADLPEPNADITVTFIDFAINVEGNLTAGDHILKLQNHGAQPHFLELDKGPDMLTDEQVTQVLMAEMGGGTPPDLPFDPEKDVMPVLSTATQSIGTEQWVPASLESGTYVALCFFPTAGEGMPHAMHGMHTVFKVQ